MLTAMRKSDWLILALGIAVILMLIWTVKTLKAEAGECLRNPITYYEEKKGMVCQCGEWQGQDYVMFKDMKGG